MIGLNNLLLLSKASEKKAKKALIERKKGIKVTNASKYFKKL